MSRSHSAYQSASLRPKVITSACTPWVRPIIGVWVCSAARVLIASPSAVMPLRRTSQASTICSAWAVSTTSEEVRPKCSQRADGPTISATEVVKAITSCWVVFSISSMRAMLKSPRFFRSCAASAGTMPAAAMASAAATSTWSQVSYLCCSLQMRPISGCV
jgi:hypothetical protein